MANGKNGKLIITVTLIVFSAGVAWGTNRYVSYNNEQTIKNTKETVANHCVSIGKIETMQETTKHRLERMENKIDKILDKI